MGTPVVATRVGAIGEVVGDAAVLIESGDVDALAAALDSVLTDAQVAADLVDKGLERVKAFDWSSTVDGLVVLYRTAAAAAAR